MGDTRLSRAEAHQVLLRTAETLAAGTRPSRPRFRAARFAPGERVMPGRRWPRCLGVVVQGRVVVYAVRRATRRPLHELDPGQTFGPLAASVGRGEATLVALTPTRIRFLRLPDAAPAVETLPRRRLVLRWGKVHQAVIGLLLCLGLLLVAGLPAARSAVAAPAMAIGQWCAQRAHVRCAERTWALAGQMAPADVRPPLALGILLAGRGNLSAARAAFEHAAVVGPDSAEAHNNLGVVYLELGQADLSAHALRQALACDPGSAAVEQNLAQSLLALGQYGEAAGHYRSALGLAAPRPGSLTNLALAYLQNGEPSLAEQVARRALESEPASASLSTVRGVVALGAGRTDEALALFQEAVAMDAAYTPAAFYMSQAQLVLGNRAGARASLLRALDSTGEEAARTEILSRLAALDGDGAPPAIP